MTMPIGLMAELTTEERIERLLLTLACVLTKQPVHKVAPWLMT